LSDQELYSGMIRLHILHHATREPVFGLGLIEELARHGYSLRPGTVYPMLRSLEKKGYLPSAEARNGKHARLLYRATPTGRKALREARSKVWELFGELLENDIGPSSRGAKRERKS
jgi:DNA-binding PadR family transcriptional regulator